MMLLPVVAPRVTILVVDDERDNRELLNVILACDGFRVVTAAGGEEALAAVAVEAPSLILLDLMMPGMDGFEVAARLKGSPSARHIPIIIVSALTDRAARARAVAAGVDDFLLKPTDRDVLVACVRRVLAAHPAAA